MEHADVGVDKDDLYKIRHSLAHVLAQAVLELRPGSTLGFGPPIKDGFYYDFVLSEPLSEDDFPAIEKKMKFIIKKGQDFEMEQLGREEAFARIDEMGEPYKREYAEELFEKQDLDVLTFYRNGPFLDMCEGPHVANTRKLPKGAFKLRSIAGAYWRGNEKNQMMTRIYAWAFATPAELQAHIKAWKLLQERDHKKLGSKLDIFLIDEEIGKGLPLWMPNGTVLREELEKLAKEMEFKDGYQRVSTPVLTRSALYYKSGHLPYYADGMFPPMELKETREGDDGTEVSVKDAYMLKPMNCPHHHKIYAARLRSYRDLPLRLAEYGLCHRYEDSGSLSGLLRVRGMCMNDAHIYCTEDQVIEEFLKVMDLHRRVYEVLGLTDYYMRFSTHDPDDPKGKQKYIDDPEGWAKAEDLIRRAMEQSGLPYVEEKGEAAFYGPKIDVQFRTVTGREETASTNQLDFGIAPRFDLTYIGPDGEPHRPYIIHRAPLGTHERFIAFLIEHYGGAFPTWLAPTQVRVLPVTDEHRAYGQEIVDRLRDQFVRAELDNSGERLAKMVRTGTSQKIPNLLVIGDREVEERSVTLRCFGSWDQTPLSLDDFEGKLMDAIRSRSTSLL